MPEKVKLALSFATEDGRVLDKDSIEIYPTGIPTFTSGMVGNTCHYEGKLYTVTESREESDRSYRFILKPVEKPPGC